MSYQMWKIIEQKVTNNISTDHIGDSTFSVWVQAGVDSINDSMAGSW